MNYQDCDNPDSDSGSLHCPLREPSSLVQPQIAYIHSLGWTRRGDETEIKTPDTQYKKMRLHRDFLLQFPAVIGYNITV